MTGGLEIRDVHYAYRTAQGFLGRQGSFKAVDGVSFRVERGSVFGLIGESGCGKSTLARMLVGLEAPDSGDILLDGVSLMAMPRLERARKVQIVFQDPNSSLNPRKSIASILTFPLRIHGIGSASDRRERAAEMLRLVGLPEETLGKLPSQLSGGQRQRIAIARALIVEPQLIVCDEPTSALDVSVQAQILNLLDSLRRKLGLTYLLISHDLAVVEHMAERIAVMSSGRIVELNTTPQIMAHPQHPYTRLLLESVLPPDPAHPLPVIDDQVRQAAKNAVTEE